MTHVLISRAGWNLQENASLNRNGIDVLIRFGVEACQIASSRASPLEGKRQTQVGDAGQRLRLCRMSGPLTRSEVVRGVKEDRPSLLYPPVVEAIKTATL